MSVHLSPGSRLRALLGDHEVVVAPGASDALTARLIEKAGFPAVYVTGAGIANALLGVPDVGLTTLTEVAAQAAHIVASVIFVEGLLDEDEFRTVGRELAGVPLVANMVAGGKSPLLSAQRLGELGFRLVILANLALRLGALAIQRGLAELRQTGTSAGMLDRILPWDERQAIVGLADATEMERRLLNRAEATMAAHRRSPEWAGRPQRIPQEGG